ncbi:enoyl-CoA hydratase/isomerase family protein [Haloechinothrix salitolerans]|uniref:Enoyl-CoA hydratase/isomerase family protein n=1 Tax=Haloechinothrix salitolerans TaxID=926830 RepID=A0ABW2BTA0_9PSEU
MTATADNQREDTDLVVAEAAPHVLRVSLNRPHRRNALTPGLMDRLTAVIDSVADDPAVRALVVTGNGAGFCSGFDLREIRDTHQLGLPELLRKQEEWAGAIQRLIELPLPVIAAVNGAAVGAGMSLALAADMRVVTEDTTFGAAFVRIGLSGADLGLSWTLPRTVGMGLAAEMMLTGRPVDGTEAYRIGLANRVCTEDDPLATAVELAQAVAANSPFGVALTKKVLHSGVDAPSFAAAVEIENRNQILASRTEDMAEALRANAEGRRPEFRNR